MHALEARGPFCFEVPPLHNGGRPRDNVQSHRASWSDRRALREANRNSDIATMLIWPYYCEDEEGYKHKTPMRAEISFYAIALDASQTRMRSGVLEFRRCS
jgi:hypothetical protein